MTRAEVIRILKIERECISRDCDRDCANCDLVQERDQLLEIYDNAIALLSIADEDRDDPTRWKETWIK